jgi:hypothetical protein
MKYQTRGFRFPVALKSSFGLQDIVRCRQQLRAQAAHTGEHWLLPIYEFEPVKVRRLKIKVSEMESRE